MIDKDNQKMLWFLVIVIGIVLIKNAGLFSINIQGSDVVYYNEPIIVSFSLTNFTNPFIEVYFNDIQIFEEDNETIFYTQTYDGNYEITIENINTHGLLKIKAIEENNTEIKTLEVRQAYVDIKENIPNLVDKGKLYTIEVDTFNPQGDTLDADSVDIEITDPLNNKETIFLEKSGNKFTKQFNYKNNGNYILKINAREDGYVTKQVTRITSVAKPEGIHPIVYVYLSAAIIWFLLFGIKMLRRFT